MRRAVLIVLLGSLLAGCGSDAAIVSTTSALSEEAHIERFCELYSDVRNMGRQEMMLELIEVAPPDYREAIDRESRLAGSIEDSVFVDGLLTECDARLAE